MLGKGWASLLTISARYCCPRRCLAIDYTCSSLRARELDQKTALMKPSKAQELNNWVGGGRGAGVQVSQGETDLCGGVDGCGGVEAGRQGGRRKGLGRWVMGLC